MTLIRSGKTFLLKCGKRGCGAMKAYDKIPEWNELVFREPTAEEREEYAGEKFEQ